jgi:hypothetical protein
MNSNQLMTAGAIGFAGFALWWITRKPGNTPTAAQPAQAQRDIGLQAFYDLHDAQSLEWNQASALNKQHLSDFFNFPTTSTV